MLSWPVSLVLGSAAPALSDSVPLTAVCSEAASALRSASFCLASFLASPRSALVSPTPSRGSVASSAATPAVPAEPLLFAVVLVRFVLPWRSRMAAMRSPLRMPVVPVMPSSAASSRNSAITMPDRPPGLRFGVVPAPLDCGACSPESDVADDAAWGSTSPLNRSVLLTHVLPDRPTLHAQTSGPPPASELRGGVLGSLCGRFVADSSEKQRQPPSRDQLDHRVYPKLPSRTQRRRSDPEEPSETSRCGNRTVTERLRG